MANLGEKRKISDVIQEWKPRITYLVIGLVFGPFISGWLGWQVTAGTMDNAVQDAVVSYRAERCVKKAQADPTATADVLKNWTSRRELAEKSALLPGEEKADTDVINACSTRLTP